MTEKKTPPEETAPSVGAIADLQRKDAKLQEQIDELTVVCDHQQAAIEGLTEIGKVNGIEIKKLKEQP